MISFAISTASSSMNGTNCWARSEGASRVVAVSLARRSIRSSVSGACPRRCRNLPEALHALMGTGQGGRIIRRCRRAPHRSGFDHPAGCQPLPWAGHMGSVLVPEAIAAIASTRTTLLFTNTRAQARDLVSAHCRVASRLAGPPCRLHHGSIDRKLRARIEQGLKSGELRCAVCTSSLDLGVDFPAVDQVIQAGSPKGIGRLMQRAVAAATGPARRVESYASPRTPGSWWRSRRARGDTGSAH